MEPTRALRALAVGAALLGAAPARGKIVQVTGPTFDLTARAGSLSMPDGFYYLMWGYALGAGLPQYPGPTLSVTEGDLVTVTLRSEVDVPVSLVFPGQEGVTATGGSLGALARESTGPADVVTYQFVATHPGTYLYHSGTQPALQVEMGLFGALIVRPATAGLAYDHPDTAYDRETLFLLSELDPAVHDSVEYGMADLVDPADFHPTYWLINGRAAPDTMAQDGAPWLPFQPYACMPRMLPGEKLLMRVVNAGRDLHPFHHHGNHARVVARDGRLLSSGPGAGPDLSHNVFTVLAVPGETVDAIFTWTGHGLGWDVYGHRPSQPLAPGELLEDHGGAFPVVMPEQQDITLGPLWSGGPFLGVGEKVPPGAGGMNPNAGFTFMWHSHTEMEMVNFDLFPGGMMTMLVVEPPGTSIE